MNWRDAKERNLGEAHASALGAELPVLFAKRSVGRSQHVIEHGRMFNELDDDVAGFIPALKAARLNPIQALRYE